MLSFIKIRTKPSPHALDRAWGLGAFAGDLVTVAFPSNRDSHC